MASPDIAIQIKCVRSSLSIIRKDVCQVYNMGCSATKDKSTEHLACFRAMFPSCNDLRTTYITEFKSLQELAIINNSETLFPLDEDVKKRTELITYCYKIVQFSQELEASNPPPSSQTSLLNTSTARSRLPNINIPKFSGTIAEWPKFKQIFCSIIHDNSELPDIEKFHYLSCSLSAEPLTLISAYTINAENYSKAWKALLQRYDDQRLLATSYVEKVLDFEPMHGPSSLKSLQLFSQVVFENIAAFKSIPLKDEADLLWLTLALRKLDGPTRKCFEESVIGEEWPSFKRLVDFIQGKCKAMQLSEGCGVKGRSTERSTARSRVLTTTDSQAKTANPNSLCFCKQYHPLSECPIFRDKSPGRRRAFLTGKRVCYNCLRSGHLSSSCTSNRRCKTCNKPHHTLLHDSLTSRCPQFRSHDSPYNPPYSKDGMRNNVSSSLRPDDGPSQSSNGNSSSLIASVTGPGQILLGTALVHVPDMTGKLQPVRLLLDCGSQLSLITASCAKRLGIPWQATSHRPLGAGQVHLPHVKGKLRCDVHSRFDHRFISVEPLVVSTITGNLPTSPTFLNLDHLIDPGYLADPDYGQPGPIDFLLGNDNFMYVLTGPVNPLQENLGALSTIFGFVLMGNTGSSSQDQSAACLSLTDSPISDSLITRFWELEEVDQSALSSDIDVCEQHFLRTHYREPDGRYVVALPFKDGVEEVLAPLSESRELARSRFYRLESKLRKDSQLMAKYSAFMEEYQTLGHMSKTESPPAYVIPHHGVFRSDDVGGKIRVVFDASMRTSAGSLNDWLMVGSKLQQDVTDVIIRFRMNAVALTTDLVKMYRQIRVIPDHSRFQCIWWRARVDEPEELYKLQTVTYGESSAPYLALRCVKQLISDEGSAYPLAAKALSQHIYVDDVVSGADTVEGALELKDQLIQLLSRGQFFTHKWKTNSPELLRVLGELGGDSELSMEQEQLSVTKILGMSWDPKDDVFFYEVNPTKIVITKRGILSTIARLFDPIGFLGPVTFMAKCIMQRLWLGKYGWDETPDESLCDLWRSFASSLPQLSSIRIPRYSLFPILESAQLIGFCDASQKGFAAAIYLRVVSEDGTVKTSLLKSKTRVAPLKTVSIPRLELCGAHLLIKLFLTVFPLLDGINISAVLFFTDSTIVLSWLRLSPHELMTFVANRVSYIISHTSSDQWKHVPSSDNPADIASRGLMPHALGYDPLWWAGPKWLSQEPITFPPTPSVLQDIPELRSGHVLSVAMEEPWLLSFIRRYSRYSHLIRTLAYVMRFIKNVRSKESARYSGPLTLQEIDGALKICVKAIQRQVFALEFDWKTSKPTSRRLLELCAFLDDEGLLRVGGRLQHADIPFDSKSPMILPGDYNFSHLIIDHYHYVHFHLGNMALQTLLRKRFWIFRLRQVVRSRIVKCVTCARMRAQPCIPIMGALPGPRVRQGRPFLSVGIDYAGPFAIKQSARKNAPRTKAYLCIFVCMATRAVHLECVSDMTTDAFLAAMDRMVARRGLPLNAFSDCGRNFLGAARRLQEFFSWLSDKEIQAMFSNHATNRGFQWHFNPPYAPHFGGLWEAAVKSVKYHLYRVIGDQLLTFEELGTFFARVEAILNSRPIGSTGEDPSNLDPLTPGHFLTGEPLVGIPEPDLTDLKLNRLSRWQLIQSASQHFWRRWHAEYLHTLQKRTKWFHQGRPLKIGDLVLLPDPSTSRQKWPLAKVVDCHTGEDGVVRVVSLRTPKGNLTRAVHKLVPLCELNALD